MAKSLIILVCLTLLRTAVLCQAQSNPLLIAWQAPAPPTADGQGWAQAYNPNKDLVQGTTCYNQTQFACFIAYVLPKISGIGVVVPWAGMDSCGATQCYADDVCDGTSKPCFKWSWLDTPMLAYLQATIGTTKSWSNGCAGGRPCKVVLIVWLTADTGNANLYTGQPYSINNPFPNTPTYVFTPDWANFAGGCSQTNPCAPQDVLVCQEHQGGSWGLTGPPMQSSFANNCAGDVGLWNANGTNKLVDNGCWSTSPVTTNFSGYPVMYENPIYYAARNFIRALSIHYSPNCTYANCGSGPTIAQSIAYMRVGPSGGGENYPACACKSSSGGAQCDSPPTASSSFWPGPQGFSSQAHSYTDQGYLTTWTGNNDASGYVASLYSYIRSRNWAFPVDSPMEHGPPQNMNYTYPDTEASLANQNGLGMGMQALNIGDLVTYAANTYNYFAPILSFFPSTVENWAVNFREFPNVPVHHLQTEQPGSPTAARFTISDITISNICTGSTCQQATIHCSSSNGDCKAFCPVAPWVYIDQSSNPAFNGIQQVYAPPPSRSCGSNTINLIGTFPYAPNTSYSGGYVYSGVHLPALLPFVTQQCQGSLQTVCSVEIWEEILDWAYGTSTISATTGDTSSGDPAYQTAIQNYLSGLPNTTSFHINMSTNANHY